MNVSAKSVSCMKLSQITDTGKIVSQTDSFVFLYLEGYSLVLKKYITCFTSSHPVCDVVINNHFSVKE